jgi:hypothetical protein
MKTKTTLLKNKQMNPGVYKLRREVISLVCEAKKLIPSLPRITVRVTEDDSKILGVGRMHQNIIWITSSFVASRAVVFHEILHAVFGQEHKSGCPLMAPQIDPNLSRKKCDQLFTKYANQGNLDIGIVKE